VRWYRRAAEQDDVTAQLNLGACYELGRGVAQDYAQALAWYRRAADQGEARAQANLGHAYASGRGVAQDYTQAAAWYRRAADQGHAPSQYDLADLYARALGVQRSDIEACRWLLVAESRAQSADERATYAAARERLARRMTAPQITEAQRLAREWFERFTKK